MSTELEEPFNDPVVYQVASDVVYNSFDGGVLVFSIKDRKLFQVGQRWGEVLGYVDGVRNVPEIARLFAKEHRVAEEQVLKELTELYAQMLEQKIITQINPSLRKESMDMTQTSALSKYLRNPDVVLREEDEDGGLLFNPDTNQLKVVNSTGLFIWKQLENPQELKSVVDAIQDAFEDVSLDAAFADAQEFIQDLIRTGFIGTVVPG